MLQLFSSNIKQKKTIISLRFIRIDISLDGFSINSKLINVTKKRTIYMSINKRSVYFFKNHADDKIIEKRIRITECKQNNPVGR